MDQIPSFVHNVGDLNVGRFSTCVHGYVPTACPFCSPRSPEPERERRLTAFLPLIHAIVGRVEFAPERDDAIEQIERILELVENPRRKVDGQ